METRNLRLQREKTGKKHKMESLPDSLSGELAKKCPTDHDDREKRRTNSKEKISIDPRNFKVRQTLKVTTTTPMA